MSTKSKTLGIIVVAVAVASWAPAALALPVEVPDFAGDPSGLEFTIGPILPGDGLSSNIAGPPLLTFGATDPGGTTDVLIMSWQPVDENMPAQAGWELAFGADPDLTGQTISLSINPPGMGGLVVGGITHLEVVIVDINGLSAGGWGFNTDQVVPAFPGGYVPLGNDPLASGKAPVFPVAPLPPWPVASLAQNWMQTVNINIGAGPAPASALITGGPIGLLIGPNYLVAGNGGSIALAASIQFYENGVLAGNQSVPANAPPGLNNYWDHIIVTPEPATLTLLALGGLALIRRRRT
jgi:MYXO-CTERM domain-containing protein